MARHEHLPIYKTTYDLLIALMHTTKNFPREFKFTLGEKIQNHILELLVDIYRANSAKDKRADIISILEHVQYLNLFMRISFDLKILTTERYAVFIEQTGSISKQAQGWLKNAFDTTNEPEPDSCQGITGSALLSRQRRLDISSTKAL
ncbi:MAG: four helix bundle protein [Heliobacteriaceae bacterium]|jgi:hypothetical protein|nr:four helix bundle protein [Heliobacteriaceae bacterium]